MSRLPARDADPEHQAAGRELTAILEAAIDALPEIYRLTFTLREVQQLSTAEAAECLEVSEDVVKIRLFRAKAMLREALAAHVDARAGDAFSFMGPRCDRVVAAVLARLPRVLH